VTEAPGARVALGPVVVDALTFRQAVEHLCVLAQADSPRRYAVTPNIQHVALLRRDAAFRAAYRGAALVLPDGFPVCLAMRPFLGRAQERVTGADLVPALCEAAAERGLSVGFLGGRPGASKEAARRLIQAFPGLDVALVEAAPLGFDRRPEELERVLREVARASPQVLFVGLGAPKGELFLARHADRLGPGVALSVGAAIDFQAGLVSRAPARWQALRLEWVWRIRQEPRRLAGRYLLSAPAFLAAVGPDVLRRLLRRPTG
jgi:N-acetylglucosaminyldiphosphoundecaprenol N-acetyl-beta-D-mannosaminyltransferase